jgi:hypothetical protein
MILQKASILMPFVIFIIKKEHSLLYVLFRHCLSLVSYLPYSSSRFLVNCRKNLHCCRSPLNVTHSILTFTCKLLKLLTRPVYYDIRKNPRRLLRNAQDVRRKKTGPVTVMAYNVPAKAQWIYPL